MREVYPGQPIQRFANLEEVVDDSVSAHRAYAVISGAFAVVMLLLSGVGLCGHLSHVVAERAPGLAIRSALGASSKQQLRLVIRHVAPALIGGVSVALLMVYLSFPLLASFLFEVGRFDVISCVGTVLLVTSITIASILLPARRVSGLEVNTILRSP